MKTLSIPLRSTLQASVLMSAIQVFAASCLLALASQVSFFLPYTPVFVTMQTAALFFIGMTLGPVKGTLAVLLYLMEGALGLPVFALGQSGLATIIGPRGGYLAGFVLATFISGHFSKKSLNFVSYLGVFLFSNAVIFAFGLSWLSLYVGIENVLALGLYPFIVGDLFKVGAIAALMRGIRTCN